MTNYTLFYMDEELAYFCSNESAVENIFSFFLINFKTFTSHLQLVALLELSEVLGGKKQQLKVGFFSF